MSKECPKKKQKYASTNESKFQGMKKNRNMTYSMIQSLFNELDEENKAICMKKLEDEGF
jgi:bifunctional DNase/RNase